MNLAVRPACLKDDRGEMVALLERNFPSFQMGRHFRWRHESNPAGPGWSWVIYERKTGKIGAMTSLFPRPMYFDGKPFTCGQVGEFAVDNSYRSLGPAVMLQRATFEPVDSGQLPLCYDCPPHNEGMSTFVRIGMRPSCELVRYAFLVRSEQVLEKRLGNKLWTKPIVTCANLALSLRSAKRNIPGIEICKFNRPFGHEFTRLDQAASSAGIIRLRRSAEILNWRYRERSDISISILVARRNGELQGFLVLEIQNDRRAAIRDLFGLNLETVGAPLVEAAIDLARHHKVFCVEGYCSGTSPLNQVFYAAGFRRREMAARIVAYAKDASYRNLLISRQSWTVGQAELMA